MNIIRQYVFLVGKVGRVAVVAESTALVQGTGRLSQDLPERSSISSETALGSQHSSRVPCRHIGVELLEAPHISQVYSSGSSNREVG